MNSNSHHEKDHDFAFESRKGKIRLWLRKLFHVKQFDRELVSELQFHIEHVIEANVRSGMSREEARRAALRDFGGVELAKEECRDERPTRWLRDFFQDVRFGLRMLRKSPGFAAVAVLTLALGIGANTAIFSVVEGVVLAPLPYRQPDRLTVVLQRNLTQNYDADLSYLDFLDWQKNNHSVQEMAAYQQLGFDLTSPGSPEHLDAAAVSANFFHVLGVNLALGRQFLPAEDVQGGARVAIITDALWAEKFSRSPNVLGQTLTLDGANYSVVGILQPGFSFAYKSDVYVPAGQGDISLLNDRSIHGTACIARLKDGVTLEEAHADLNRVQGNLNQLYPTIDRGLATTVLPLKQFLVGNIGSTLILLLGAVGIVLLIACANVANLLLARSAARSREFAIRLALGAGRGRVIRQMLTESLFLSLVGGAAGLLAANWGLSAILAVLGGELPRQSNITVSTSVLLFALGVSMLVGILFGIAPALKNSSVDPQRSLTERGGSGTRAQHRVQSTLVISQVALALVLLTSAGLLFRTIRRLWQVNPGLNPQNVVTFQIGLSPSIINSAPGIRNAFQQTIARIQQIPGVQSADLTSVIPLSQADNTGPFWIGPQPASLAQAPRAIYYEVGPAYLQTMGIPLLRGRFFTPQDAITSEPVVVVDDALARRYFPNGDAVGQRLTIAHWATARIVGVVGHVKQWGLGNSHRLSQSQIYISFYQLSDMWVPLFRGSMAVVVRTTSDAGALMPAIRATVYGSNDNEPVYNVQMMRDVVAETMAPQRLPMMLLGAFAALALLLASIGIYGVISYSVTQRTREIGIRIALGAESRKIFGMVIAQGLRLAIAGLAVGAVAAAILTRVLSNFSHLLYGVRTNDPLTFVTVSIVLTGVAVLACYIPARRATRVDPMTALCND